MRKIVGRSCERTFNWSSWISISWFLYLEYHTSLRYFDSLSLGGGDAHLISKDGRELNLWDLPDLLDQKTWYTKHNTRVLHEFYLLLQDDMMIDMEYAELVLSSTSIQYSGKEEKKNDLQNPTTSSASQTPYLYNSINYISINLWFLP